MRRYFIVALGLVAMSSAPATAADLSVPRALPVMAAPPPPFSWTGCYLGGYVGGGWGSRDVTATDLNGYNGSDVWGYKLSPSFIGGGTLGCNYQTGQFVFGLEGEGGYLSLRGSALDPLSPFVPLDTTSSTRIGDWYAMATGRIGTTWDSALFYVKGGAAFVNTQVSVIDPVLQPVLGNTISATSTAQVRTTWTIGGGIEYAFAPNWSVKGEYMFIGLSQSETVCGVAALNAGRYCWSHEERGIHTAKIGLNYLFNTADPVVARY